MIGDSIGGTSLETTSKCPKCGDELQDICLTSNPPQYMKQCPRCGYSTTPKRNTSNAVGVHISRKCEVCGEPTEGLDAHLCRNCRFALLKMIKEKNTGI